MTRESGQYILIARPRGRARHLVDALGDRGVEARCLSVLDVSPPSDPSQLVDVATRLAEFDWIVFTSVNAVAAFRPYANGSSRETRVAAVGPATARAARRAGWTDIWTPRRATGVSLAETMPIDERESILLPRGDRADDQVPSILVRRGATVHAIEAYRTTVRARKSPRFRRDLLADRVRAIVVSSPSAVRGLIVAVGHDACCRAPIVAIGPTTGAAAIELGLPPARVSRSVDLHGFLDAVAPFLPPSEALAT